MKITTVDAPKHLMKSLRAGLVPMLASSPGIGKSSIIKQLAEQHKLKVIDLRLSQCDPTDLNGFPSLHADRTKAGYLPMDIFPIAGDPVPEGYRGWILLLDEINSASSAVQAAAYKIVLDKQVGMHDLHPNVAIVAAGNLATDKAIVNPMSTAMQSRMVHYELDVVPNDWVAWAHENEIDYRVPAYINFKPGMLHSFDPSHDDATFPCPRTWEFVSKLIVNIKHLAPDDIPDLAGAIGEGPAREFFTFCEIFKSLPTIDQILANPEGYPVPNEPSVQFALVGMITHHITDKTAANLVKFMRRLPVEFFIITIRDIVRRKRSLLQNEDVQKCVTELSRELM